MGGILAAAQRLYGAMNSGDGEALQCLLHPDFVGLMSPGLPQGWGRRYDGLEAMLGQAWAAVDELFELQLLAEEFLVAGDLLIVRGLYSGSARASGRPLRAPFAHFWRFDGHRFTGMQQITDTGLWRDAVN